MKKIISLLIAVVQLTWRSVPELGFVFLVSLILSGLYHKTNSLTVPIVVHGINNVMLVSGMALPAPSIIRG